MESSHLSHLQVDDSICAVALHGVELKVALEVLSIEAGDGKTIAKTSLQGAGGGSRGRERVREVERVREGGRESEKGGSGCEREGGR